MGLTFSRWKNERIILVILEYKLLYKLCVVYINSMNKYSVVLLDSICCLQCLKQTAALVYQVISRNMKYIIR